MYEFLETNNTCDIETFLQHDIFNIIATPNDMVQGSRQQKSEAPFLLMMPTPVIPEKPEKNTGRNVFSRFHLKILHT